MNNEPDNLVLSLLREMRADNAQLRVDVERGFSEVKERLSAIEEHQANTRADIAALRRDIAIDAKMRTMLMRKVDEHSDALTDLKRLH